MIADLHGGKTSGISFPFGECMKKYGSEMDKLKKLLPEEAIKIIESAKTCPGGNEHLRAMHYFARDHRHRIPIDPINVGHVYKMESLGIFRGRLIRLGYRFGAQMIPEIGTNNLVVPPGRPEPELLLDGGDGKPRMVFRPDVDAGDNQMEFISVVPGTKFQCDLKPSFDISLAEVPALSREPLIVTLHRISELVEGILLDFERRFFPK